MLVGWEQKTSNDNSLALYIIASKERKTEKRGLGKVSEDACGMGAKGKRLKFPDDIVRLTELIV